MSLVAYDSSDESEEEISMKQQHSPIPKTISNTGVKKQRESVKITIPSLKEFEEEENDEMPKKKPKFQSGSGLFSLLPPPKNSATLTKPGFMPYVLKSKKEPTPSSSIKKQPKQLVTSKKCEASRNQTASVSSDQDSDDDISNLTAKSSEQDSAPVLAQNFFSLEDSKSKGSISKFSSSDYLSTHLSPAPSDKDKAFIDEQPNELSSKSTTSENETNIIQDQPFLPFSSSAQQPLIQNKFEGPSYSQCEQIPLPDELQIDASDQPGYSSECSPYSAIEPDVKQSLLKDKEFLKIQGRHRRELENIDIIDVNATDQLSDKNEWLMKSLTEESTYTSSRKKANMPTQQQKRKHQITYLAFQAKEREMDLKNQWAMNSRTRRETQAKYGF